MWGSGRGEGERQTWLWGLPLPGFTLKMQTVPRGDERPALELGQLCGSGECPTRGPRRRPPRRLAPPCAAARPGRVGERRALQPLGRGGRGCSCAGGCASLLSSEIRRSPRVKLRVSRRLTASLGRDAVLQSVTRTGRPRKSWRGEAFQELDL